MAGWLMRMLKGFLGALDGLRRALVNLAFVAVLAAVVHEAAAQGQGQGQQGQQGEALQGTLHGGTSVE